MNLHSFHHMHLRHSNGNGNTQNSLHSHHHHMHSIPPGRPPSGSGGDSSGYHSSGGSKTPGGGGKSNLRSSRSSDSSSAYSGSDTMQSPACSSGEPGSSTEVDEVDLSGLMESVVDSDEDEECEETSLLVRDAVRECLEKDPSDRTSEDIDTLLEFTQHLKAFTNMTLSVRRALVATMVFAVVDKAGTVVMTDGEELDSWSVIINGNVEVLVDGGKVLCTFWFSWFFPRCDEVHITVIEIKKSPKMVPSIGTSYPKIATNFKSL